MSNESDYSHRFHVGNHADVFKHAALLRLLQAAPRSVAVIDTHAGEGGYSLGPTGEWTAGIGKLWEAPSPPAVLEPYLHALRAAGAGARKSYPGSPQLVAAHGVTAHHMYEVHPDAAAALRRNIGAHGVVHEEDGFTAAVPPGPALWFCDPPYAGREDWTGAADALGRAWGERPDLLAAVWYPIKSWSRPNQLHHRVRELGVPFTAVDLVVTPLELKRPSLSGSGMLLVGFPAAVVNDVLQIAAALGPILASHDGRWSLRVMAEPTSAASTGAS